MSSPQSTNKGKGKLKDKGKGKVKVSTMTTFKGCIYPAPRPTVPIVPLFTLRVSKDEEEWNKHKGMFAFQDIPQGTRIIDESPMMIFRLGDVDDITGEELMDLIYSQWLELSDRQRLFIWNLRVAAVYELHEVVANLKRHIRYHEEDIRIPDDESKDQPRLKPQTQSARTPANSIKPVTDEKFDRASALRDFLHNMCLRWRISSRVLGSATSICWGLSDDQINILDHEDPIKALFQTISHIQHSCMPNCNLNWNPVTERMTVHTTRPIRQGEELTHNHFALEAFHHDLDHRAALFRHYPLRWCRCLACNLANPTYVTAQSMLRCQIRRLSCDPMFLGVAEGPSPPEVLDRAERHALQILENLSTAGCEDMSKSMWMDLLGFFIYPQLPGRALDSYRLSKMSADLAVKCIGEDHELAHELYWKAMDRKLVADEAFRRKLAEPKEAKEVVDMEGEEKENKQTEEEEIEETEKEPEKQPEKETKQPNRAAKREAEKQAKKAAKKAAKK